MKKKKIETNDYLDELEKTRKKDSVILSSSDDFKTEETNVESKEQPAKKKRSKYPLYIAMILIVTAVTLTLTLKDDFDSIVQNFVTMNVPYFIYGSLCFIGCFLINSLILFLFARRYRKKYYFHQAMANDCIGNFFNCITPSASGGQPMQAYTFKKQGISLSNATSCLVMNFIVYQGVMIVLASVAVFAKASQVFSGDTYSINIGSVSIPFWVVMILGYALQFIVIGLILLMSTWRGFHNFILSKGINFLAKIKILKKPDEARRNWSVAIESFKVELKNLLINPRFLILIVILHAACFFCRYSIPHFLNQAILGNAPVASYTYSWWDTFCFASIHKMATELIPIPGSAGISEAFYYTVFQAAYSCPGLTEEAAAKQIQVYTITAQLLWRVVTFYAPLIVSGLVTAFYKGKPSKDEIKQSGNGMHTYLTMHIDTYDERRRTYQTVYNTKQINKKEFDKWKKSRKQEDK